MLCEATTIFMWPYPTLLAAAELGHKGLKAPWVRKGLQDPQGQQALQVLLVRRERQER